MGENLNARKGSLCCRHDLRRPRPLPDSVVYTSRELEYPFSTPFVEIFRLCSSSMGESWGYLYQDRSGTIRLKQPHTAAELLLSSQTHRRPEVNVRASLCRSCNLSSTQITKRLVEGSVWRRGVASYK